MDYKHLSIEALWTLVNENNYGALEELLLRFEPLIRSESRLFGKFDEDIAQDIRETFVRALKKKITRGTSE